MPACSVIHIQLFVYNNFCRFSLLSWCVELEKHGTRGVLLVTCVTNVWIHQICVKEKAKFIAKLVMAKILDPKDLDLVLELVVCKWPKILQKKNRIFLMQNMNQTFKQAEDLTKEKKIFNITPFFLLFFFHNFFFHPTTVPPPQLFFLNLCIFLGSHS